MMSRKGKPISLFLFLPRLISPSFPVGSEDFLLVREKKNAADLPFFFFFSPLKEKAFFGFSSFSPFAHQKKKNRGVLFAN